MSTNQRANELYDAAQRTFAVESAQSLREGIALLEHASEMGSASALTQLAHLAAFGVNQPADWIKSADMLREAAERGSKLAAAELALLSRRQGATPAEQRTRMDFNEWIVQRPSDDVMASPRIRVTRAFLNADECKWIVARGAPRLKRATVYTQGREGGMSVDARSNSSAAFRLLDIDLPLVLIHRRMANTVGLEPSWFEPSTLLHYAPGQQFEQHYDFLDASAPGYAANIARLGQRIVTLLIYLNEDYEGGETAFPEARYNFKGRTGDMLQFVNVTETGEGDRKTLHAGKPPTRGEKWLLSQWIRNRPAQ